MVKLSDLNKMFATETQAKNFLMLQRWGQTGVRCPRCDNDKVYTLKAKPYHWQCQHPKCGDAKDGKPNRGYRFSVITGTIFENTKYPLRTWFTVAFLMLQSKKGMSALQIKRTVFHDKASYETVWYMCTRIRAALLDPEFEHLMGIVEVDETYIGGKKGNKHKSKRGPERGPQGKIPVLGAISRKGNVIAEMVQNVDSLTCEKFIKRVIDRKNLKLVATDESKAYINLKRFGYPHDTVDHKAEEYVRGLVHTQSIESFWSLLKRGIMGNYHHVSAKYLPLYLNEFVFRFNNRKNPDIFHKAIAGC